MEKRYHEFAVVEQKANATLSDTTPPCENHPRLLIHISMSPAFGEFVSWLVFSDQNESAFVLRKIVWDQLFDRARFANPMEGLKHGWHQTPTISTAMMDLKSTLVHELLSDARKLNILDAVSAGITLDGVRWTVFVDGAFGNVPRTWNAEPKEWRELIDWCKKAVNQLDNQ